MAFFKIQGFANFPIDNLYAIPLLTNKIRQKLGMDDASCCSGEPGSGPDGERMIGDCSDELDIVVVSPDAGGAKRASVLAKKLGVEMAIFAKTREKANEVSSMTLVGDVRGKRCVLVDDMVDTGGSLCKGAEELIRLGAKEVHAVATHGVLSPPALDRLNASPIVSCVFADTIPLAEKAAACPKIEVVSVAPLLAQSIKVLHYGGSLSSLFDPDKAKLS